MITVPPIRNDRLSCINFRVIIIIIIIIVNIVIITIIIIIIKLSWPRILLMYDSDCTACQCRESNRHSLLVIIISDHMPMDQEVTKFSSCSSTTCNIAVMS